MTSAKTSRPDSSATKVVAPPPFDKLYWLRIGLGVVAGLVAAVLVGGDYYDGISIGILVYLISYYGARYGWYRGLDRKFLGKLYTTGLGGFVGLFLFTWILVFTINSV